MEKHDMRALADIDFFHYMTDIYRKEFPDKPFPFRISNQVQYLNNHL